MVPVRLRLRNFLSYREACDDLDFTGLNFVCLTGENGHGKSALLDAITWALWGAARGGSDDDLIHRGCSEAEVELDFRVGEVLYRVNRKRRKSASATSAGKTILEFQVRAEDGWKALTGQTVKDSERRIIDAVRLDFDTFKNSAFLAQGRADEFTTRTAGKRIEVLAGILGLDAYERYERRARDEARRYDGDARRILALSEQLERSLEKEPQYQREAQESRALIAQLEADIKEGRLAFAAAQEAERAARSLQQQRELLDRDIAQARARAERAERDAAQASAAIAKHRTLLDRAETIRADHADLQEARRTATEQTTLLARLRTLEGEAATAQRALDAARAKLSAELDRLDAEIERLASVSARQTELDRAGTALDAERRALTSDADKLAALRDAARDADLRATEIASENKRRRTDMDEIKRKQKELAEGGADCPICGTALGEQGKARIRDLYEGEGKELAAQYRAQGAEQSRLSAEATRLHGEIAVLEKRLTTARSDLDRRTATHARDSADARAAAEQLPGLQSSAAAQRAALERGEFAPEQRAALQAAEAQIAATAYDTALHERATAAITRLAPAEQENAALLAAAEGLQQAEAALSRARDDAQEWRGELCCKEQELVKVAEQLRDYAGAAERLHQAEQQLRGLEEQDRRQRGALGAAEQQLENCRGYRLQLQAARLEHTTAKQQKQIYDDLTLAFGKKGVQALIIDAAVPEIEQEANNLLSRMTDGRMSVKIETQKQTQKGQTVETLDIAIGDDLGTRPYELYSGGEAFRINLALRIALAKLLARRAGAPLPTLIIDEGFGTQDADGRERLMEALDTVAQDFECLIVITHLDELKDRFERRIVVEKTPLGSVATIV